MTDRAQPALSQQPDNLRGIIYMLVAGAAFAVSDAAVKLATERLPLGEVIVLRGLVASAVILTLASRQHRATELRLLASPPVLLRTIGEIGATVFYLSGLQRLPLANAAAILQLLPFTTTLAAGWALGERIGRLRWLAIGVGFAASLLILRPGAAGDTLGVALALLSVGFLTLRDVATRRVPQHLSTLTITALTTVAVTAAGLVMSLGQSWIMPDLMAMLLVTTSGLSILLAFFSIANAMRYGEAGVVAPYRYSVMIYALLLGLAIWGHIPDLLTLVGVAILVVTGIAMFGIDRRARSGRGNRRVTPAPH